jgi:hypothetical protein
MKNWFNSNDRAALMARLEKLAPQSRALWGKMNAHQTLCHLAEPLRSALGENQAARIKSPLGLLGLSWLIMWYIPWPKGAPTTPAFLPGTGMTSPTEFQKDKATLVELLQRFSHFPTSKNFEPSPVFGRISRRSWGRITWRHLDHHLRQFGE